MPVRTAAQKRKLAKIEYDAYLAACPSRHLLDTLANKWVCLILSALAPGKKSMRHGEIARHIAGVSQKMLTQTLRALERDGLVSRTVTASVPVRVDYALTPLGADLAVQVGHLKRWAEVNMHAVLEARQRHDQVQGALRRALEKVATGSPDHRGVPAS
jgi:DNA-binding HxlR family transcriptional regulator